METITLATKLQFSKFLVKSLVEYEKTGANMNEVRQISDLMEPFVDQMDINNKRIHQKRLEVLQRMVKAFSFVLKIMSAYHNNKSLPTGLVNLI